MTNYTQGRIDLALELINSHDPFLADPEKLATPADLGAFLQRHGLGKPAAKPNDDDLKAVHELRDNLRHAFTLRNDPAGHSLLASLLDGARTIPELTADHQLAWRSLDEATARDGPDSSSTTPGSEPVATLLRRRSALGLAEALALHGPDRLKSCAAEPCQDVFIDTLRNRSRRFCSPRCANRHHVAEFRRRA